MSRKLLDTAEASASATARETSAATTPCAIAMRPLAVQVPQVIEDVRSRGGERERKEADQGRDQLPHVEERERRQQRHEKQQVLQPLVDPEGAQPRREAALLRGELALDRNLPAHRVGDAGRDADQ